MKRDLPSSPPRLWRTAERGTAARGDGRCSRGAAHGWKIKSPRGTPGPRLRNPAGGGSATDPSFKNQICRRLALRCSGGQIGRRRPLPGDGRPQLRGRRGRAAVPSGKGGCGRNRDWVCVLRRKTRSKRRLAVGGDIFLSPRAKRK